MRSPDSIGLFEAWSMHSYILLSLRRFRLLWLNDYILYGICCVFSQHLQLAATARVASSRTLAELNRALKHQPYKISEQTSLYVCSEILFWSSINIMIHNVLYVAQSPRT